jgi:hypothetical protein
MYTSLATNAFRSLQRLPQPDGTSTILREIAMACDSGIHPNNYNDIRAMETQR